MKKTVVALGLIVAGTLTVLGGVKMAAATEYCNADCYPTGNVCNDIAPVGQPTCLGLVASCEGHACYGCDGSLDVSVRLCHATNISAFCTGTGTMYQCGKQYKRYCTYNIGYDRCECPKNGGNERGDCGFESCTVQ